MGQTRERRVEGGLNFRGRARSRASRCHRRRAVCRGERAAAAAPNWKLEHSQAALLWIQRRVASPSPQYRPTRSRQCSPPTISGADCFVPLPPELLSSPRAVCGSAALSLAFLYIRPLGTCVSDSQSSEHTSPLLMGVQTLRAHSADSLAIRVRVAVAREYTTATTSKYNAEFTFALCLICITPHCNHSHWLHCACRKNACMNSSAPIVSSSSL